MKNRFAENFLLLRKQKGWHQQDVAKKLNTTQRKVSYWENGKVEPDLETLWDISEIFEISIDELLGKE